LYVGQTDADLAVAERLVNVAPTDESAYEFLVRVHLAKGNRLAAQRAYRACSEMMRIQYGDAPSAEFAELLERSSEPIAPTGWRLKID
jgi:DNA-binding SARP family transcriptional activator